MSYAANAALDQAATICYKRAEAWKVRENDVLLTCGESAKDLAALYSSLCNEADDCKLAIRQLKIPPTTTESDVIRQLLDLTNFASSTFNNPNYEMLRQAIHKIQDERGVDLYVVHSNLPSQ